ncbi:OmpA family protein [Rhizobium sp. DKSPLA3]|uniref:OmpA family protein n=1 Tax=Rhizobium quercicola TaxID=2901226 RepID=A0A9X1T1Z6_9HYPH|nr:OmpA family protein [Rhizobium quercicola]MCD7110380.1 OmpA family protein [Rhizobium quercicola]
MTIRSKLFATVAMPLLTMTIGLQPALADAQMKPFQVAQADPEEELPRKRRPAEGQQEAAPQGQAEPSESGEGRPSREERRKQREAEQPAEEQQQRQAEPSGEDTPRPSREERRKQREAEQQQNGEQPQAQPSGEDTPRPSREERRKQREAEQQQNGEQPQAQPSGEDTPRPSREERRKQREAEQQKQNGEQAQPEGQPMPDLDGQAPRQSREERRKQREAEQQKKQDGADTPEQIKPSDLDATRPRQTGQDADAPDAAERKRQREERIRKREAERLNGQQDGTQQAQPGDTAEQPASGDMTDEERARIRAERRKQREADGQQAEDPARPGVEPNGADPAQAGDNRANRDRPARDVVDTRSREEREKLARDPSKSDETVVLPVENGAAVLDSDKDADNRGNDDTRDRRRREREQVRQERDNQPPPRTDADAQSDHRERRPDREELNAAINERGRRIDRAPEFDAGDLIDALTGQRPRIEESRNNRTVLDFGDEIVVRSDDRPRLRRDARETYYEELPRGRTREVIERPNGMRVVTIYNRYGDVIQRTRINSDGEEYLMVYAPEVDEEKRPPRYDVGEDLPPMRLTVPVRDYIIDTSTEPDRDYYDFLAEPPVERVERTYSLDEVRNSARIRDKVRRIDLDTITFATGSAEVPMSQAKTLRKVADAMLEVIDKDPGETFLIEGHTDAVGSDQSNLVLSDERAESVAALLTDVYEIPPENLVTQGYGERFLKVRTSEAEQENRRVTIRRVTPLVRPVAQK